MENPAHTNPNIFIYIYIYHFVFLLLSTLLEGFWSDDNDKNKPDKTQGVPGALFGRKTKLSGGKFELHLLMQKVYFISLNVRNISLYIFMIQTE